MALKKAKGGARFDSRKFVSTEAFERHNASVIHKFPVPECSFDINPMINSAIYRIIEAIRWHKFNAQPLELNQGS